MSETGAGEAPALGYGYGTKAKAPDRGLRRRGLQGNDKVSMNETTTRFKGTPGPYEKVPQEPLGLGNNCIQPVGRANLIVIVHPNPYVGADAAVSEANADLFAASWDLLYAASEARRFFEVQADVTDGLVVCSACGEQTDPQMADEHGPTHADWCPAKLLRAAVAKALGGAS